MFFGSRSKKNLLPLLTLRDVIIFPHQVKPLIIGRPQSVSTLLKAEAADKSIVLVMQKDAELASPKKDDLYQIGTFAKILEVFPLQENKYKVLIRGERRVKISDLDIGALLWNAEIEECEDQTVMQNEHILVQVVHERFEMLAKLDSSIPEEMVRAIRANKDAGRLADALAPHMTDSPIVLQELLEMIDVEERLNRIATIIQEKIAVFEVDQKIQDRVKQQIDRNQKEYYLNEKMQAIQKELGDDEGPSEFTILEEKIQSAQMSAEAEDKSLRELKRLKKMSAMSAEATVSRSYLDWMTSIPWQSKAEENHDLKNAKAILDEAHYGLDDVKRRILEYLAVRQVAPNGKAPILCLVGPPGVGKTSLARSIADATGRPYVRQALGGVRDESEIRGHRRTYIGSMPGKIIQTLKRAGVVNPVFLLDEIDKMSGDYRHGDPAAALLEALDPEQNNTFRDHYVDIDYDLSQIFFICTANDLRGIPGPLQDRLEILELSTYTEPEKMEIVKRYLIPKQLKEHCLTSESIIFSDAIILRIIRAYTRESGVRELERQVGKICRKVVRRNLEECIDEQVVLTSDNLADYLDVPRYLDREVLRPDSIGVINGLAVTPWGGELLEIEVAALPGKGELVLTGRLGDWLKESARAGLSCIRMRQEILGLEGDFQSKHDIHIHYPGNALKTDGPSAGLAMTCAMISSLTNRPIRSDVAMTGEISLRGRVLAIGGVKEKLLAAHSRGMTLVFLPKENEAKLSELPEVVRNEMSIIPVSSIDEVLPHIFETIEK